MRPLAFLLLLALLANFARSAEPPSAPGWPLWDGAETVEQYSRRAGLEQNKTLDLGNGIKMELVLIPAGKFVMGTEKPTPVDERMFATRIWIGQFTFASSGGVLLVLLGTIVIQAIRKRRRPQYSLARLLVLTLVAGVALLGGLHWHFSAKALPEARAEYQRAAVRFKDAADWEKPAHQVTLTKPYYLGKLEVTEEQYLQIMSTKPFRPETPDLPTRYRSWNDAVEFCKKVSEKTRWAIRLPTEAEWEHACRAGTRTTHYTGDAAADLDRTAWLDEGIGGTTHPVGTKVPNAWGLHDMYGNVEEWVWDVNGPYKPEPATDPQGPEKGPRRVYRGGSWFNPPWACRSACRASNVPDSDDGYTGFRVAADVPPKAP
jgi:formylglycine-generating enzyme required for sulfatase activity